MGVIIPPGFAQSTQQFLLTGSTKAFSVVLGHNVGAGETAVSIANEVRSRWATHVWGASSRGTNWALGACRAVLQISPGIAEVYTNETITPGTVGIAATPPPNVAMLVKKVTPLAGRRHRGRMYMPPVLLAETNIDALGIIDSAALTAVQGWFTALYNGFVTASLDPVLLHSDGGVPTEIDSFVVQSKVATQRERLR